MATEKWSDFSARGAVLTTEMDSLANGSRSVLGTEVDNNANNDRFAVLELVTQFGSSPTDYSTIDVYMVPAVDGTNYGDGSDTVRPSQDDFVGAFQLRATTSQQRLFTKPFELLPCKFKFLVYNGSGQSMGGTGNSLNLHTFNREIG